MSNIPTISLRDALFEADKYGTIDALRAKSPVARTPDGGIVFLTHEACAEVLKCEHFRFTFNLIDTQSSPYLANAIEHELLNKHADEHLRLSRLVKQALRERVVDGMRARIDAIISDLLDEMETQQTAEFCSAFGDPLPARVLGPMFGVPYEEAAGLNDWIQIGGRKIDALQSGVDIQIVEDANRKMHDYLRDLLRDRRKNPGEDLFSELIRSELDGDRLSEDEVVYLSTELAAAGVDTTRTQLPLILHALLTHPDQMATLRADPSLALRCVDEGMRFAPLTWAIPHAAVHDMSFRGLDFKEGDLAFVLVPAANRDASVVANPHAFDIARPRARHFTFGSGMHACPGAQLARMEMASALSGLIARFETLELAQDPEWLPGQVGRGLGRLNLRLTRAA